MSRARFARLHRKDPLTSSVPPESAPEPASETSELTDAPRPRLRRDLRREAAARAAETTSRTPDATRTSDAVRTSDAATAPNAATAPPVPPVPPADEPLSATFRAAPSATRRGAAAVTSPPRQPAKTARRPWAKTKALGATFAVGAMVAGAALPALNPGADPVAAVTGVSLTAAAGDTAQSFSSTDEIRAEIAPRGSYSATTPEEIEQTRSRAVAAALAAGMPLNSAVTIPLADSVVMPMADGSYSFTDGFGASRPGRSHLGQDFAAPIGSPINAAMKGCVSRSTESYQGYGVTIQIESVIDGESVSTVYSHMNYGTRAVEVGDCVEEGQYIGDVGATGYVFGSCLHFEVHIDSVPVDPMRWLEKHVS